MMSKSQRKKAKKKEAGAAGEALDLSTLFEAIEASELDELKKLQPEGDPAVDVKRCMVIFQSATVNTFCQSLLSQIKVQQALRGDMFRSLKNLILTVAYYLNDDLQARVEAHCVMYEGKEPPAKNTLNNYLGYFDTMRWHANSEAIAKFIKEKAKMKKV